MELPRAAQRGVIPGTERLFVKPEYILTVRVREGVVEIAAIRSARQADPYAPPKLLDASDDPDAEGGSGGEPREPREPA
jgi:hypothetical protein